MDNQKQRSIGWLVEQIAQKQVHVGGIKISFEVPTELVEQAEAMYAKELKEATGVISE
jgi:hypothetical protein